MNKIIKRYNKERDEVVLSLDVEKFKAFARKWQLPMPPSDRVIEITMRKMACHIPSLPEEFRADAKRWLEDNGFDDKLE